MADISACDADNSYIKILKILEQTCYIHRHFIKDVVSRNKFEINYQQSVSRIY